jgi:hypothetical protein
MDTAEADPEPRPEHAAGSAGTTTRRTSRSSSRGNGNGARNGNGTRSGDGARAAGGAVGDAHPELGEPVESRPVMDPAEQRMVGLMEEFRRRQRKRPDVAVRPWWSSGGLASRTAGAIGFVLEYCPHGVASAHIVVRRGRVTVEGPEGTREATIDLTHGWRFDDRDVECPETLANYLLRLASQTLGDGAA